VNREETGSSEASQRPALTGGLEESWNEAAFGLRERFNWGCIEPNGMPADAPYPYLTVGPGRREAGRDCGAVTFTDGRPNHSLPSRECGHLLVAGDPEAVIPGSV
jgi:hypothetical protein